jgi:hypothetical protein
MTAGLSFGCDMGRWSIRAWKWKKFLPKASGLRHIPGSTPGGRFGISTTSCRSSGAPTYRVQGPVAHPSCNQVKAGYH